MTSSECSKLQGIYRGIVLKHLPHGRCKIFIPSIYDNSLSAQPNLLPDAEQASPLFGGTNNGNGTFSYPNLSSIVWCLFENGDQNYPVYVAATLGGDNAFGQFELVRDPGISSVSDRHLVTAGQTQVEMYEDGRLSSIVSSPIRTNAAVQHNTANYLAHQDDAVSARYECDKVADEKITHSECQQVFDVNIEDGTLSAGTHLQVNEQQQKKTIDTEIVQSNKERLDVNVKCSEQSKKTDAAASNCICKNSREESHSVQIKQTVPSAIDAKNKHNKDYMSEQNQITAVVGSMRFSNQYVVDHHETTMSTQVLSPGINAEAQMSMKTDKTIGYFTSAADQIAQVVYKNEGNVTTGQADIYMKDDKNQHFAHIQQIKDGKLSIETVNSSKAVTCQVILDSVSKNIIVKSSPTNSSGSTIVITSDGNVKVTAPGSVSVLSPSVSIAGTSGDSTVHVTGTLTVTGDITSQADVIASNCTLNKHVHPYVWAHESGAATTSPGV